MKNNQAGKRTAHERATFNARLTKRMKTTLQRAADLRGQSLSDFILASAYDRALETIEAESVVKLSERDSETFARALLETPSVQKSVVARFRSAHRKSLA